MKQTSKLLTLLILVSVTLYACAAPAAETQPPPTNTPPPPPPTATPEPPTPTPSPPPDPWGDIIVPPGEAIQVAFVGDFSGQASWLSQRMHEAATYAIEDYGQLNGFPIEIVNFDDNCNPDSAQKVTQQVLENPNIVAVTGMLCSQAVIEQLPYYEAGNISIVVSGASTPGMEEYAPTVWNQVNLDDDQAAAARDLFNLIELPSYKVFIADFETRSGGGIEQGGPVVAASYDSMMVLLQALEASLWQDADGALVIGRQALRDNLRATKGYEGASGYISIDENGKRIPPVTPDPWGDVTVPPGETINLALLLPTTEQFNIYDPAIYYAIETYGPIKGFDVEGIVYEDFCFESGITTKAIDVVADPQSVGVIGPLCSPATLAALPFLEEAHVPMISFGATRQDLPNYGRTTFNRVLLSDQQRQSAGYESDSYFFMEPAVQQFLSEFAAWANIPIQDMNEGTWMFYPLAYDATNVMLSAIDQVAQYAPDGSLVIGRQALSEAIRATKGFDGITGIITLDNKGNLTPP